MGILSLIVFIPFLTAIFILFAKSPKTIKSIALAGTGLHLLASFVLTYLFFNSPQNINPDPTGLSLQFVEKWDWFSSFGVSYFLGVDGISLAMILLTSVIIFTGVLASWNVENRSKEFFALLLLLVTGVFGVFVSFDLFLFFIFYEVAVLPMYLLIGIWGTGPKEYSAMKLTLMLMLGSAFLMVAFLGLFHLSGLNTFDMTKLAQVNFDLQTQRWIFPTLFVGFGILGALYPFHTWSPDGHASAPTAVSMLHAGVLMKLGGYGALRIAVYLLPEGAKEWALFFMALTTINILYGSLGAIKQKDLKYFTAYSSVSHCGMVLFGVATLNFIGFKGAVLQMVSHGLMTGLFFSLIGMVYGRTHTRIINEMGGLAKVMPWLATSFYIAGFASLGLPSLSGFVAESQIFMGGFMGNPWHDLTWMRVLTVLSTMSIVVTAVYVLRGLAQVFMGPITNLHFNELTDASLTEKVTTALLIASLFFVGLYPKFFVDMIEPAINPIINRLNM